jgi:hypothetical protein
VVGELSTAGVLNCSLAHALSLFDFEGLKLTTKRSVAAKLKRAKELSGKTKKAKLSRTSKPTMILPFCGVIVTDWCYGVRLNHGLHTQCTNARVAEGEYCKTCTKAAANSATDKPPYGDIRDRASSGVNYRDPKGRQTLPYANVAEKLKLDIKKAHVAATLRITVVHAAGGAIADVAIGWLVRCTVRRRLRARLAILALCDASIRTLRMQSVVQTHPIAPISYDHTAKRQNHCRFRRSRQLRFLRLPRKLFRTLQLRRHRTLRRQLQAFKVKQRQSMRQTTVQNARGRQLAHHRTRKCNARLAQPTLQRRTQTLLLTIKRVISIGVLQMLVG